VVLTKLQAMKSAYELAMERLEKKSPAPKLTDAQKEKISELTSLYEAKLAERETFLQSLIASAQSKGDFAEVDELRRQLARDLQTLRDELDAKKNKVWNQA